MSGLTESGGGDTIYLSVIDRDGNIVSLIQSLYSSFGSGIVAPGTGVMLHNRGGLFTLEDGHPNQIAPRKRPLHTIIPGFMQKDDVNIGFGIMGGFNQAQAHAQFVSDVVDFGLDVQQALEVGRFTKVTFGGCDVDVEALVPEATRRELAAMGHDVKTVPPQDRHIRLRPGGDEQRRRRPLRRIGTAPRWCRDPRSAERLQTAAVGARLLPLTCVAARLWNASSPTRAPPRGSPSRSCCSRATTAHSACAGRGRQRRGARWSRVRRPGAPRA